MEIPAAKTYLGSHFTQIAWVVKDIEASLRFFKDTMGISNFSKPDIIRVRDFKATYYGKPSNAESLVAMAYTGGIFIELIQPLSGNSVFQDYINENPAGGIQHVAYSVPVADLDKIIADFEKKGYEIVSDFDTPIAKIVFFDTRKEIGVFTEVMGITEVGIEAVEKMKWMG